jgi:hypothetical protein
VSLPALDNLVRAGQLKAEPRNEKEFRRLLAMAHTGRLGSGLYFIGHFESCRFLTRVGSMFPL